MESSEFPISDLVPRVSSPLAFSQPRTWGRGGDGGGERGGGGRGEGERGGGGEGERGRGGGEEGGREEGKRCLTISLACVYYICTVVYDHGMQYCMQLHISMQFDHDSAFMHMYIHVHCIQQVYIYNARMQGLVKHC